MRAREGGRMTAVAAPVPRPDCWVHPAAVVRPSPIAGRGLFTTERLTVDTVVLRLGGELVTEGDLRRRMAAAAADPAKPFVDSITIESDLHLIVPPGTIHYGNHSCDPSLWFADPFSFVARRDIDPGEELTNDYATTTGVADWAMDCSCASVTCRRRLTGQDWKSVDLQRRYGVHWTPGLRRLIAEA